MSWVTLLWPCTSSDVETTPRGRLIKAVVTRLLWLFYGAVLFYFFGGHPYNVDYDPGETTYMTDLKGNTYSVVVVEKVSSRTK